MKPWRRSDNSATAEKMALRHWGFAQLGRRHAAYEVFGTGGLATPVLRATGFTVCGCHGEAHASLWALRRWDWDWYDIDPYGDPWTAAQIILTRATAEQIGLFLCDARLPACGKLRSPSWPPAVRVALRCAETDTALKHRCWTDYESMARRVLTALASPRFAVVAFRASPRQSRVGATVRYSAAVCSRQRDGT